MTIGMDNDDNSDMLKGMENFGVAGVPKESRLVHEPP
jgi:hypothetical protein